MQLSNSFWMVRQYLQTVIEGLSYPMPSCYVSFTLNNFSRIFTPLHLYRYRACGRDHSFSDVESNQITLSAASKFQDIHDAAIHDTGEMERMVARIVSQTAEARALMLETMKSAGADSENETAKRFNVFADEFFDLPNDAKREQLDNLTRQMKEAIDLQQYSESLREQLQIACLCGNPNSSYMWENYGGNGSGYVIEYKTSQLFDIDLDNHQRPLILPVIYANQLPDTLLLPISQIIEPTAIPMMSEEVFKGMKAINLIKCVFYKQIYPFANEEEWRLQLTPQKTEEGAERIFRNIRPSRLLAGPKMGDQDRERLNACGRANNIPVSDVTLQKKE